MDTGQDIQSLVVMKKLQKQRAVLEEKINQKCCELKKLCIAEAELTGTIPMEIPLEPNESPPRIRRRIGTMFPYNDEVLKFLINQRVNNKTEEKSPKRKLPLIPWNNKCDTLPHQSCQANNSTPPLPACNTWSPKRRSPKKIQSRSHPYLKKLKIMKW